MTFSDSLKICLFSKCGCITGRAGRAEFWWFFLAAIVLNFICVGLSAAMDSLISHSYYYDYNVFETALASAISFLVMSLCFWLHFAGISVTVRRLHDINRSGKWVLIPVLLFILGFTISVLLRRSHNDLAAMIFLLSAVSYIVLLIMMMFRGSNSNNRFGYPPYNVSPHELKFSMSFSEAVKICMLKKLFCIKGRAGKAEFWWFIVFDVLMSSVLILIVVLLTEYEEAVGLIILLVPFLWLCVAHITAAVRRLHDSDKSGWYVAGFFGFWISLFLFIKVVPLLFVLLFAFCCFNIWMLMYLLKDGTAKVNRYGEPVCNDPFQGAMSERGEAFKY